MGAKMTNEEAILYIDQMRGVNHSNLRYRLENDEKVETQDIMFDLALGIVIKLAKANMRKDSINQLLSKPSELKDL